MLSPNANTLRMEAIPLISLESFGSAPTIFHHPAWQKLLADCYGYRPHFLALQDSAGKLTAGLPLLEIRLPLVRRNAIALPFSDFCPPLGECTADLVRELQGWRRQQGFHQLVIHWPIEAGECVYEGERVARHLTMLNPDSSEVFRRFKRTQVQQPIRQAEKAGVEVQQGTSWEDVLQFYRLHLQTRRRHGVPVQPLRFFRLIWERLIAQGLGFVLLASQKQRVLAGAVFFHWNKTLTYKFSASDPRSWQMRPNNLILWHAIQWGCDQGYAVFDWGRSELDNQGLRDFKNGWGSQEQILNYSILADQPPVVRTSSGPSKRLLSTVIRHSPGWVCRMIGELFYALAA
jgi:hypothetical protein